MSDNAAQNGNGDSFDIDAVTNLIVPFEFPFEGRTLKGKWYKYKTTTPEWAAEQARRYSERLERFVEIRQQLVTTKDTALILKLNKEKQQLEDEAQRAQYDWLADAIVEWNAVSKGQAIPIKSIKLRSFPTPFMVKLGQHLEADRAGENPTLSGSSSGS